MNRYQYRCFILVKKTFAYLFVLLFILTSCENGGQGNNQKTIYYNAILDSVAQQFGYPEASFHFIDSVFADNSKMDFSIRFKYYSYVCGYYHIAKQADTTALLYADTLLMLVKNKGDSVYYKKEEAHANISMGDILFALKKYNDAYFYYYLGKVAAQKSMDACTYSEYSYRLAMVMYKTANYHSAAVYFKQGFTESVLCEKDFNNFYRRQELLNNTALSYARNGEPDSASLYYNETLKFINSNELLYPDHKPFFSTARAVIYGNTGQLYTKTDYAKAESLFKKSIEINATPGHDINDALVTQLHLASLYHDNNKTGELDVLLKEIKTGLDTITKNDQAKIDFNRLMWKVSGEKKQITEAYRYLLEYNRLKDIEAENDNKLSKTSITAEIKSLESDYNLKLLKKDNKLQNIYILIAAGLFIISAAVSILIWSNWRRSRLNVQKLTLMNTQVQFQKAELESAFELLELRDKEKDKIFQILAHDLRNPIAGIHALTAILADDYQHNESLLQMFELIRNGCDNALELINEILESTAYERERPSQDFKEQVVDVNRIVNSVCRLLRFKAGEKKQVLRVKLNPVPQYIMVHPSRLFRVLNNLITNAVKFSPPQKNISVEVVDAASYVHVIIRDEGIGLPESMQAKLFEPDETVKRDGTAGEKSYGMGLVICKQIMESYDGKIWFESAEGKGTCFFIAFKKELKALPAEQLQKATSLEL